MKEIVWQLVWLYRVYNMINLAIHSHTVYNMGINMYIYIIFLHCYRINEHFFSFLGRVMSCHFFVSCVAFLRWGIPIDTFFLCKVVTKNPLVSTVSTSCAGIRQGKHFWQICNMHRTLGIVAISMVVPVKMRLYTTHLPLLSQMVRG